MIVRLAAGAAVSAAVSIAGWRASALNARGAIAATGVGTAIAAGSSWPGMVVLGTFFVSSSALSRGRTATGIAEKGSRRDERQVLANGAIAAAGALAGRWVDRRLGLALAAGALAAAAADTWATELGASSRYAPRLICSGRAVMPGTSGGVTARGSIAALGGASVIGLVSGITVALSGTWSDARRIAPAVVVAGVAGSLVDSILGELLQDRRFCPSCHVATEARVHSCGTSTTHVGGIDGFDNDVVNAVCTAIGCMTVVPYTRSLLKPCAT